MTVQEAYEKYRITPALQLHQLRAAGIARILCEKHPGVKDKKSPVIACLFHDMGNIIKFDLAALPEFLEPQGPAYWQNVKDEYTAKYGTDEHTATYAINREIGVPSEVQNLIEAMGFSKAEAIAESGSVELQILEYSDQRVAPHGVASLEERLADGHARYIMRKGKKHTDHEDVYKKNAAGIEKIERQLFVGLSIKPEDINEEKVAPFFEEFRKYEI